MLLRLTVVPGFALALAACSGKVFTDGTGAGGSGGTGGVQCPISEPSPGGPCSLPAGLVCEFGTCCPATYTCDQGSWSAVGGDCVAVACPPAPPANGEACDPCVQVTPCSYDLCDMGQGVVGATCGQDGLWASALDWCPGPLGCVQVNCQVGEICLIQSPPVQGTCAPDPCAPDPLSCDCAQSLCTDNFPTCTEVKGNEVWCVCVPCE
jgi:hypothetical protein